MNNIYLSHNNIVSAYGFDSASAVDSIKNEVSGLSLVDDSKILPNPFYSSLIPQNNLSKAFQKLNPQEDYTRLEQILLVSLANTLKESGLELTDRVGLIVSTTKGNIDVLDADSLFDENRAYLSELGNKIKTFFRF
ncbi:hypothetical protein ACU8V7_09635 [Zobellia nedashkovskayae]